jgi:hypothetical protein
MRKGVKKLINVYIIQNELEWMESVAMWIKSVKN